MKVALISNMNNNYFVLLRYLIDLGVEAKLFRFIDEYDHFTPENDTWYIEKWEKYIDSLPFTYYNHYETIKNFDKNEVKQKLKDFDILIGSGPSPAYLSEVDLSLDFFMPYKTGIEYYKDDISWKHWALSKRIRDFNKLQQSALKKTKYIISHNFSDLTHNRIKKLGMKHLPLGVPMVYKEELKTLDVLKDSQHEVIQRMKSADYVIMHLGRHLWKRKWTHVIKGHSFINNNANDKVIEAFATLSQNFKYKNNLLVLFEYGTQIELSKGLVEKFGVSSQVAWVPLSSRKEIMQIIPHASIGVGDIAVGVWGGKAFEFLANGVPLINSVSQKQKLRYETLVDCPIPPLIPIKHSKELYAIFEKYLLNKHLLKAASKQSLEWFIKNDGLKKAELLLKAFKEEYELKKNA